MRHLELAIAVRPEAVEAVADMVRSVAPAGVSIEPPFEAVDEDGSVSFPEGAATVIRAWLPDDEAAPQVVVELRLSLEQQAGAIVEPLSVSHVAEEDWADVWKEHFQVTRVGERIVLRPSWRDYDPEPGDVVVAIDPGRAFGTGQHETTRMCLIELERRLEPGARVLDLGCGSGILSATAALLGAARIDAVDIDAAAVGATTENAAANGVMGRVRVARGSLGETWPFEEEPAGGYHIVVANISSRVIRDLASAIMQALALDGVALVSGIIADQEQACVEALLEAGAKSMERRADGDWRLLAARR